MLATIKRAYARVRQFPSALATRLRKHPRIEKWFYRTSGPEPGVTFLHHRRVYIVPTRLGFFFGVVLIVLLLASINYSLNLGYILTFLIAAFMINGMNFTFRNLAHVSLRALRAGDTTVGSSAPFELEISTEKPFQRRAVFVSIAHEDDSPQIGYDLSGASESGPGMTQVVYPMPAPKRGRLIAPRMRLQSSFPLGMWVTWSYWQPDLQCIVYPAPEHPSPPLPAASAQDGIGTSTRRGADQFAYIRDYHRGDSLRHIAWKSVARTDQLVTKEFEGNTGSQLWLNLHEIPPSLGLEARLSRMAAWVLMCEQAGHQYGLALGGAGGTRLEPDSGAAHRDQCMMALALYEEPMFDAQAGANASRTISTVNTATTATSGASS